MIARERKSSPTASIPTFSPPNKNRNSDTKELRFLFFIDKHSCLWYNKYSNVVQFAITKGEAL